MNKEITEEKFANFLAWLAPDSDLAGALLIIGLRIREALIALGFVSSS